MTIKPIRWHAEQTSACKWEATLDSDSSNIPCFCLHWARPGLGRRDSPSLADLQSGGVKERKVAKLTCENNSEPRIPKVWAQAPHSQGLLPVADYKQRVTHQLGSSVSVATHQGWKIFIAGPCWTHVRDLGLESCSSSVICDGIFPRATTQAHRVDGFPG